MSNSLFSPLIYVRDCSDNNAVELRVVEYQGGRKIEHGWKLPPDKAVSLGLEMAERGWHKKLSGTP